MRIHSSRSSPRLTDPAWRLAVIESIVVHRTPQTGFEAVYMLMPTTANVDRIIRDFSGGRQQYAGAHLFFIDGAHVRRIATPC